ncbi:MAG: hypothetical protein KGH69_00800 [Candidatus Micrarchaeota archaeon]|nr:hypothetical protein [Candidatus Micrarchaeota archaeon]
MMRVGFSIFMAALFALTALAAIAQAANQPPGTVTNKYDIIDCNAFIGKGQVGGGSPFLAPTQLINPNLLGYVKNGTYNSLLEISVIIVLLMFMVLGIVYAVGFAFHIDRLVAFAKTEALESVFNLVIVVVVAGGIGAVDSSIAFVSGLGTLGNLGGSQISNAQGLYVSLCSAVQHTVMINGMENWLGATFGLFSNQLIASITLNAMPGGFGINFSPFGVMTTLTQVFWLEQDVFVFMVEMGAGLIMLLAFIYFLFPLFLYLGIVLRAFPWTRAAGAAFISMFISFYIIFPALMYPFSVTASSAGSSVLCDQSNVDANPNLATICDTSSLMSMQLFNQILQTLHFDIGGVLYETIVSFGLAMVQVGVQMMGLLFALLISYDLMDHIADIIGAPSLDSRKTLSRLL